MKGTTIAYGRRSDAPDFDPYCGKERVAELISLGLLREPEPEPEPEKDRDDRHK